MDVTSQRLSIYISPAKHTEVLKFQALKRYEKQISHDMTLEIRSKVIVGTVLKFSAKM